MKKFHSAQVITILFMLIIFTGGTLTGLAAKESGFTTLLGYKTNLDPNPSIVERVKELIGAAETEVNTDFYGKNWLINLHGLAAHAMDKRIIEDVNKNNNVYKLANGQITFINAKSDVEDKVASFKSLNTHLSKAGIPFLYVQAPYKINKYDQDLPYGIEDFTNKNVDSFLSGIQKEGINSLDLRETIHNKRLDYGPLFFNTDHHWKPETGLWAASVIADRLAEDYRLTFDKSLLKPSNYMTTSYKNWFLGTEGKRVGVGYAGVDDFSLITPKFETKFEFYVPAKGLVRTGNFRETMLFMENIKQKDLFHLNPYAVYIGGDYPLTVIKNGKSTNNHKVLLVKDSFSLAVIPFLSMAYGELDVIDLRYLYGLTLKEYINQTHPSAVVFLYNPGAFVNNDRMFLFE